VTRLPFASHSPKKGTPIKENVTQQENLTPPAKFNRISPASYTLV
jgi:hypothetical protein